MECQKHSETSGKMNDKALADMVRMHRMLYDKSHPSYKNNDQKRLVWKRIAEELEMEEKAVAKRWVVLRERFSRENRYKQKQINRKRREWPTYDSLLFLKDHILQRRVRPRKTCASRNDSDKDSDSDADSDTSSSLPQKRSNTNKASEAKKDEVDVLLVDALKKYHKICEIRMKNKRKSDEVIHFGELITTAIDTLSKSAQIDVMQKCIDVAMKAKQEEVNK
ncbi:uncharacterized protein LOC119690040 [Teleopsis dalmanni]|uniref:uncharacterized protein LOC119690040 n=1 Tax=Teleopsis dalmanni TaxID=139649 RepID=UPI0018CE0F9D|nr:uncharacterized protein LOC119690040 [Teleopsis dalmanni]